MKRQEHEFTAGGSSRNLENSVTDRMKQAWRNRAPEILDQEEAKQSAVLLPLLEIEEELHILLEIRSGLLKSQPGEICFPGGAIERGETPEQAAARETAEELCLAKNKIEVLAPLNILYTPAGVTVFSYLGVLKQYQGTFSRDEVAEVFTIPLTWLLEHEPECYKTKILTVPDNDFPFEAIPGGRDYHWRQGTYKVLFYQYQDRVIWGMTAKLLYSFIKRYKEEW